MEGTVNVILNCCAECLRKEQFFCWLAYFIYFQRGISNSVS